MSKTALITGIGKGIGKSICTKFIADGFVVHGTFFSSSNEATRMMEQYGRENLIIHGPHDFRNKEGIIELIDEVMNIEFDVLIMNAGIFSSHDDFLNFNWEKFDETMYCNFYAPLSICTMLQKNLKANGSIIIVSSNDAYSGAFSSMAYSISKAALISLMKCLAVNFGERGIRVNSVSPGAIDTQMSTPEQTNEAKLYTPLRRTGKPIEVADTVLFLASDSASFITGENISIDGGYSILNVLLQREKERIRNSMSIQ